MASPEIYEALRARFPEDVLEHVQDRLEPYVKISPSGIERVARFLRDDPSMAFNYLVCISTVDEGKNLAAVYHIESFDATMPAGTPGKIRRKAVLKVEAPREDPVVRSLAGVWATANWHEREAWDLMGIRFEGHPDLKRILTEEDWEGHPLRKDYVFPRSYRGIDLT